MLPSYLGATEPTPSLTELFTGSATSASTLNRQYAKAAPLIDWLIDYYPVAIGGLALLVFGAAAVGAWYGSKGR
jgi:hypothetical protein